MNNNNIKSSSDTNTYNNTINIKNTKCYGACCEMKVYAYHGGNRSQDVDFLASCDVVSDRTFYSIICSSY